MHNSSYADGLFCALRAVHGVRKAKDTRCLRLRDRDAKLAVLEWDPEHGALRPSSLHYFESDPALRSRCNRVRAAAARQN